jgi:ATP-dependent RNA helicase DBP3
VRTHLSDQSIPSPIRVLVFALYKQEVPRVVQFLERQAQSSGFGKGVTVEVNALHGDINQNARMQALEWFKTSSTTVKSGSRSVRILVATDVAARGLDIPSVGLVINYTFPLTVEDYVHRIGRTGRGGSFGKSVTFFTGEGQEKALAGEFARLLSESGEGFPFNNLHLNMPIDGLITEPKGLETLRAKFPMTIKKKEHSAYGAFYKNIDKDGVNGRSKEEEAEVIKRRKIVF